MIREIRSDIPGFKTVRLEPGFNLILAERAESADDRDTRNGAGKSTLVEIIHFCLGSRVTKGKGLRHPTIDGATYSIDLVLNGEFVSVSRSTTSSGTVTIEGEVSEWPLHPVPLVPDGPPTLRIEEWKTVLGTLMFGLPLVDAEGGYRPTFRSLVSYFVRRGKEAFLSPFEHNRKQATWDKQINNAYLLGLAWEYAAEWQELKDRRDLIDELKKAARGGIVSGILGSLGDLEASKVRLEEKARQQQDRLRSFQVHEDYRQIEDEVNNLTKSIHQFTNESLEAKELADYYRTNLAQEQPPGGLEIERLYSEAQIVLPESVLRQLSEVRAFHETLIRNRQTFLRSEIERFEAEVKELDAEKSRAINERAKRLRVLETHGALEEYTQLQERYSETVGLLNDLERRIRAVREMEEGKSELKISLATLERRARADFDERRQQRDRAIAIFNSNSEFLYNAPGKLLIDITPTGYSFGVQIEREASDGINNMKIFCYDLMLAQLWGTLEKNPGFMIHDSIIFDGVDERQRALALELALQRARNSGFQYICMMNSDATAGLEFQGEMELDSYVRLKISDDGEEGGLFGKRF